VSGVFTPKSEIKYDEAGYGVIDGIREGSTVKQWTEVDVVGQPRDKWFGHLLLAALGSAYDCVRFPISSISGTFAEGETITESTSSATGVLRRNDQGAGTAVLYIDPATGTFTGGQTLTGGTSSATATGGTIISPSAGKHHIFRRLNNNTHPSFTIYNSDPLEDFRAAYCMLDSLDFEVMSNDWAKFSAKFLGQNHASTSAQSPSYAAEAPFFGKNAAAKIAATHNDLDAASALAVERFKLTISKNLTDYQAFGSVNPASFHNQRFEVRGDLTLLYNATTQREYLTSSTKRALRLTLANTGATAISGSTYPTIQFDMPVCCFTDWSQTDDNDAIVKQTLSFVAEYDISRALTLEAMLVNSRVATY
jgi:hypothetical protein